MVNKDLVNYVFEGKQRGFSVNLLKKKLLEARFEEKNIDDAIKEVEQKEKDVLPVADDKIAGSEKKTPEQKVEFGREGKMLKAEVLGVWRKLGKSFAHPVELFTKTKGEGVWPSVKYLWTISIIPFVISSVLAMYMLTFIMTSLITFFGPFFGTLSIVRTLSTLTVTSAGIIVGFFVLLFFVVLPLLSLIVAGIMHFIVLVYGGNKEYSETFGAIIYGATPLVLFLSIPFLNFAAGAWTFVLQIFAFSVKQEMSKVKSFFVIITPALIAGFIYLVVWIVQMIVG